MQSSVDAFLYDHPEIFWFRGGSYSYAPGKKYDESTGEWTGYLAKLVYTPGVAFSGAKSLMGAYDAALPQVAARIAQEADDNGDGRCDDVELVRGIHDYLCQTLYYDTAALRILSTDRRLPDLLLCGTRFCRHRWEAAWSARVRERI